MYANVRGGVTVQDIKSHLKNTYSGANLEDVFGEDSEYDTGRQLAKDFVERSGFKKLPQVGFGLKC